MGSTPAKGSHVSVAQLEEHPVEARGAQVRFLSETRMKQQPLITGCSGWTARTPRFWEGLNPGLATLLPTFLLTADWWGFWAANSTG